MELIYSFINKFIHYSIDILPYFFLASIFGAVVQVYLNFGLIRKYLSRKFLSPIFTAVFGASAPVCSCSMIPVAQTINSLSKGYSPAFSFLISAPILSPVIFFLMLGMFGWELTVFRFVFGFIFAVLTGYIVDFLFKKPPSLPMFSSGASNLSKWQLFKKAFKDIFFSTGKFVLIGITIASFVSAVIPQSVVSKFAQLPFSYLLITVASIPVYVCSGEEIPIARSFVDLGLSYGQALTFMIASAGICIPTISAVMKLFPKWLSIFYITVWFIGSILGGVIFDLLF